MKNTFKKILLLILLLSFSVTPLISFADGLVPCGFDKNSDGDLDDPGEECTLCHFFVLFKNIMDFLTLTLAPAIGVMAVAAGGIMFLISGGSEQRRSQAKGIITTAITGIIIIFCSWLIVNTLVTIFGHSESQFRGIYPGDWFYVTCPTS